MSTPAIHEVAESARTQIIGLLSPETITADTFRTVKTIAENLLGFLDTIHTYERRQEVLAYEAYKAEKAAVKMAIEPEGQARPEPEPENAAGKEPAPEVAKPKRTKPVGDAV